jgi:IstB-like ATP binding protein
MRTKAVEVSSAHPSLPSGADSLRPAAVQVAAEPRRSETLTARTAGKESRREGRTTGMVEEFRAREPVEQFFRGGMNPKHPGKIVSGAAPTRNPEAHRGGDRRSASPFEPGVHAPYLCGRGRSRGEGTVVLSRLSGFSAGRRGGAPPANAASALHAQGALPLLPNYRGVRLPATAGPAEVASWFLSRAGLRPGGALADPVREARAMIFTTNKPLSAWGKVLHDEDLAAAILDRVLERGRFIHLEGPSGRTGILAPSAVARYLW